ncbi:hypothetical protein DAPPUDRAFT_270006 [Daphnia pulex]|uniref:Uncharacterized protein n=1 Tax=Daphnia pulex TaxID=6669 RepID=E9I025_DAPPU|nr:hypothetical protein DAPPUDRAFT_270006 [Daphnia pulex]|eukprot:EFX62655.1 hypothetical protein DAPPUDRAFT_270006 [Daphnia pulex]
MAPTSFSNPSLIGQRIYFGQLQRPSSNTQNNTTFKQPLTRSTGQEAQVDNQVAEPQVDNQVAEPQVDNQVAEPQVDNQVAEPQVDDQVAEPQVPDQKVLEDRKRRAIEIFSCIQGLYRKIHPQLLPPVNILAQHALRYFHTNQPAQPREEEHPQLAIEDGDFLQLTYEEDA